MNSQLENDLDPTPLVEALIEKTRAGKLKWEATAAPNTYISSVGGNTTLEIDDDEYLTLSLTDSQGKTFMVISTSEAPGLRVLARLARRIANKVDERMQALIEVVQKL